MPRFEYSATDSQGNPVSGLIEAATLELATGTLQDKGLRVVSVAPAKRSSVLELDIPFLNRISAKELVVFSRQFSVLMGSKVPVVSALRTTIKQTRNRRFARILSDVADDVEAGTQLSAAMSGHPKAFSQFFVNMIRSGETTGRLEEVMNYLADQMERDYDLMTRIKGAMTYPIFVISGLVIVGVIMMAFVIPKLTEVMRESGTALPWTTRLLIFVSDFMKNNIVSIAIGVVLLAAAFQWWVRTPEGRKIWDGLKLKIPVFGELLQLIYVVRFTRSLATLLDGGVDLPVGLEVVADIVGNARFREQILETRREVMDGHSITSVFAQTSIMPQMVPQMMSVGEESGRLGEVLGRLTDFYSRELSNRVSNLVSAIEPLIMMVMGLAVGIMVAAILLPMYNMATQF